MESIYGEYVFGVEKLRGWVQNKHNAMIFGAQLNRKSEYLRGQLKQEVQ